MKSRTAWPTSKQVSSFNVVADEYYNPAHHPTCNNFRRGSAVIVARWLRETLDDDTCICEVGAGKSLVAEVLLSDGRSLDQLLITDQSARMLQYSRPFETEGARLAVADAENLPLESGSIDCLVASLGDPYNQIGFWTEAKRVLTENGTAVLTVPSYDWARCFRKAGMTDFDRAEFELADGRRVFIPSFIYPESQQKALVEKAGLTVEDIQEVTLGELVNEELSPKLCIDRGPQAAVVTGYFICKSRATSLRGLNTTRST